MQIDINNQPILVAKCDQRTSGLVSHAYAYRHFWYGKKERSIMI
jgi:hypothetical protein